jgi:hypothetical protein
MVVAVLALIALTPHAPCDAPVAVFSEPDFPYYIASSALTPEFVINRLADVGIGSAAVGAEQLADPDAFGAKRFRVLAYVYGNTFPLAALDNLRRFRAEGGSVIAFGGVPFCHPCAKQDGRWVDRIEELGWEFVSHRQLGMGVWGEARDVDAVRHAEGDALGIGWMPLPAPKPGVVQFPRPGMALEESRAAGYDYLLGLPAEDVVTPVVSAWKGGVPGGHPVCLIEHHCPEFSGATDVWAGATLSQSFTFQQHEQLIIAACAYVLEKQGLLSGEQRQATLRAARGRHVRAVADSIPREGPYLARAPEPARRLSVLDVAAISPEEQLLAVSLQGLVNRKQPRIYLLTQFDDAEWLELLVEAGHERADVPTLDDLVEAFREEARGAVLYDPSEPHSLNVATTLAGLKDALIATQELADRHRLEVVEDVRGRCGDPAEAYERLVGEHWDALDHRAVACVSPRTVAPRDYLIQHRMLAFWLDAEKQFRVPGEQLLFLERLLCRMPPHGTVHGWWQEGDEGGIGEWRGVHVASQHAKTTICTAGAYNLSLHCGVALPRALRNRPIPFGSLDRRIYISFLISDGDNFGMNLYSCLGARWEEAMRGKVPVGWALCPTQVELTPGPVEYWYRTATDNDLFLTMDGLGYVYPDVYGEALGASEAHFGEFLRQTQAYMTRLDHRHLWFLGGSTRTAQMAEVLGLDGAFREYGVPAEQRQELLGNTAAVWVDLNPWEKPWDDLGVLIDRIRQRTPQDRPAFLLCGLNGFTTGPNAVARILQALGPEYVAVRPDELCDLFRRSRTQGVDPDPVPRAALDLALPPLPGPRTLADGTLLVREDDGDPEISSWFTDPQGTPWVRKRLAIPLPQGATRASVHAYVRGEAGKRVTFTVNGHEHRVVLTSSRWEWVRVELPATELLDGENGIRFTGNPEARLFMAGDSSNLVGHSDYGGPDRWTPLAGELLCYVEVR